MTPTDEELLALVERVDSWNRCWPGNLNLEKLVADLSAALRVIVAERQNPHTYVGGEASVAVCPICDIAGCYHIRAAALDVSETPESERQTDLLSESERQAIRDKALEDAAQCCEAEADKCDDAVKWGGAPKYIANCKAAAYAMRDRAYAIRAMKGTTE